MSLDNQAIVDLIDQYEKDSKALKHVVLKLCWYMRGGLTYDEGMLTSHQDREIINAIIKENLKTTEESGMPFF